MYVCVCLYAWIDIYLVGKVAWEDTGYSDKMMTILQEYGLFVVIFD